MRRQWSRKPHPQTDVDVLVFLTPNSPTPILTLRPLRICHCSICAKMLLTITTTSAPAGDLGYLLHKHPAKVQTFEQSFGRVHVFYPEVSETRCTAAMLLDVDPVG